MPEQRRPVAVTAPAAVGRCALPACVVCAAQVAGRRPLTVAEWVERRLRPAVRRARERQRDRAVSERASQDPATRRPWPYSSWWDEGWG
ncbi:hypothetical protein FHN55_13510 [Streptomyces sp. NP160]|uniref:hypothetical protein n=1 Tax=Streptomyces sp. NP160 TaxID=2586637 RepID=UPI00111A1896|nr:hypothetical protein [Streptomyces sp. NP160]TNM64536.1 hypothetical protein FHN55_13510 [Streptomyces sp. NP160]